MYTVDSYRLSGKEIDAIELKVELLVNGVALDDSALKGVSREYKEQIHWLFEWDFERHDITIPDDFGLQDGTIVQLRKSSISPFTIKANDCSLVLEHEKKFVTEVNWLPRPEYYASKTDDGEVMPKVEARYTERDVKICINTWDNLKTGNVFLTVTGTSAEMEMTVQ